MILKQVLSNLSEQQRTKLASEITLMVKAKSGFSTSVDLTAQDLTDFGAALGGNTEGARDTPPANNQEPSKEEIDNLLNSMGW